MTELICNMCKEKVEVNVNVRGRPQLFCDNCRKQRQNDAVKRSIAKKKTSIVESV